MLLAFITSVLVFIWLIVYIYWIYPYEEVYVGMGDKAEEGEEETNYSKQSKMEFLIIWATFPLFNALFYFESWLDVRDFIERNEGYRTSR